MKFLLAINSISNVRKAETVKLLITLKNNFFSNCKKPNNSCVFWFGFDCLVFGFALEFFGGREGGFVVVDVVF